MCHDNVMLPLVWRERVKWGCVSGFERIRDIELFTLREREMLLFDVIRSYKELLEIISRERISNVVDLPCYENGAEINEDNIDNYIESLPIHRRGILIVDDSENKERLKCLRVTDNSTDGDKTRINYVDGLYDLIIMWDSPVAVSYTHLDVYKRQR